MSLLLPFNYIAANWHDMENAKILAVMWLFFVHDVVCSVDTELKFCSAFFIGCTDVKDCMYVYDLQT
jgi:hypothetical protein